MRKALFFLGILTDSDIDWLLSVGKKEKVVEGTVLITEGEPTAFVYFVLEGTLSVSVRLLKGREVARLKTGEVVGEVSFVDSRPPSATVTAAEDSWVLSVPRELLAIKLEEPEFGARFYRALSVFLADRLRNAANRYVGTGTENYIEEEEEIDPAVLEKVGVAGARFDWMVNRLRSNDLG